MPRQRQRPPAANIRDALRHENNLLRLALAARERDLKALASETTRTVEISLRRRQELANSYESPIKEHLNEIVTIMRESRSAVLSGGGGTPLEQTLTGLDNALLAHYNQITGLLDYAPWSAPDVLIDGVSELGDLIVRYRHAIQACVIGHDDGEALRSLIAQIGSQKARDIIRAIQDHLESLGRPPTPGRDHLIGVARDVRDRLYPTGRKDWRRIEETTLAALRADTDNPEAAKAVKYWTVRTGNMPPAWRAQELRKTVSAP
jgi:hypothetical protein